MKKIIALIFIFVTSFLTIYAQDVQINLGFSTGYGFSYITDDENYYQNSINNTINLDFIFYKYAKLKTTLNYDHYFTEGPFGLTLIRESNDIGMEFLAGFNIPFAVNNLDIEFSLLGGGGFRYGFYTDSNRFFYPTGGLQAEMTFYPEIYGRKNLGLGFIIPYFAQIRADSIYHRSGFSFLLTYKIYG
ncbi:MAG: hypothetical protein JXR63_05175 [Spirochaetales bacterium]|nr:hypothetical protein [Spirochaetales bacterium]